MKTRIRHSFTGKLSRRQKKLLTFVKRAHGDQKRKYNDEPYYFHLLDVARILSTSLIPLPLLCVEVALCHDLFEDTEIKPGNLTAFLKRYYDTTEVSLIVDSAKELTDHFTKQNYPNLNRMARKEYEALRMSKASSLSQTVKYADILSNTSSILECDIRFAGVYYQEIMQAMNEMRKGRIEIMSQVFYEMVKMKKSLDKKLQLK